MYQTIWRDSVYRTDKMLDIHFGLELNKGKRLSYFTSLGLRNGFGLTAGVEWGFSIKGSRRLGVRLGIQRKGTKEETIFSMILEKSQMLFFPNPYFDDDYQSLNWSRGLLLDINYSLSKNITVYMSCFQTRFDSRIVTLIQRLNGASAGLRLYMGKGKKNSIPSS
jgi:hypothetical protein